MKTVILCGGQGTRIRDVSADIPKPMIAIGRYPILLHIMLGYARFSFTDFVLCLGYQSHVIKDFFLNYQARTSDVTMEFGEPRFASSQHSDIANWRITLAETGLDTMTGARVLRVRRYVEADGTFMLTY